MRYDVKKFLFIGNDTDRDLFFKKAQEAALIHFIDIKRSSAKELPPKISSIIQAIKVLRGLPVVEQEEAVDFSQTDTLSHEILSLKARLEGLLDQERVVRLEMSRVEPFGEFSLDEVADIEKRTNRKIQFYCAKMGYADTHDLPDGLLYICSDNGLDYFAAINTETKQYPKMIEMRIDRSWGDLAAHHTQILTEIHDIETQLKGFAKYNTFLHHALRYHLNKYHLQEAKNFVDFPIEKSKLFVVQGWVPANKIKELEALVAEMQVHIEEIEPDKNEVVPTCLQNEGAGRIGQDLVAIYDTPSNADRDPSIWVLVFFALFFSMIIGDGGYGLILLAIALYVRYKHSKIRGMKKRVLDLFTILGFSCIVWGVLTTSFFGISFAPDNPIRKVSLMSWLVEKKTEYHIEHHDEVYQEWVTKFPKLQGVTDSKTFLMDAAKVNNNGKTVYEAYDKFSDNIMLELALFVGVLHLIISMCRTIDRNWSHIGWIIFLVGAYLYTPYFLGATSMVNWIFNISPEAAAHNGLYMIYGGFGLAVVIALFRHKLFGLLEASQVIQIFGDALSYLRLYALGLSGAMLTATMNELSGIVPVVFGVLILVAGHAVNLVLCIMGGVIHGLRLNFLEWYHYSFEGGGKIFNPLRKIEIE